MKIIYLHQYFNTPSMEGGTRSYEIARRLVAKGHEVDMITTDRSSKKLSEAAWRVSHVDGITVHWYSLPYANEMNFFSRVKAFIAFAIAATRRSQSINADLVIATSTPLTIAIPGLLKHWKAKIPMVFEVRDLWPELPIAIGAIKNPILKFFTRQLERIAYHNSEAVIALSPGMRDGVVSTGYASNRVCVIPNACDNSAFEANESEISAFRNKREWLGNRRLVLYAGTLGEINGVGYLVNIAQHLHAIDPEIRILIVGQGKEREKIIAEANVAGVLNKNLFVENYLPKNEMPILFGAADISTSLFVDLPQMRANSANKFFDTLAAARPILINYGGWQADLIQEYNAGLITWNLSHEEAAQHIFKHINDDQWIQAAAKSSKRMSIELFDRDMLANKFEEVLQLAVKSDGEKVARLDE